MDRFPGARGSAFETTHTPGIINRPVKDLYTFGRANLLAYPADIASIAVNFQMNHAARANQGERSADGTH